jgi:8-oxo-dGTP diphosphatase
MSAVVAHPPRPQIGIGLLIVRGNTVLLGQRKNSHGQGEYSTPGGHLEAGESFEDCSRRELEEEAGKALKIKNLRFLCVTNLTKYLPKHYVDIGMVAEWQSGEARVMEPDKLLSWDWYDLDDLPSPLFASGHNFIAALHSGQHYFTGA